VALAVATAGGVGYVPFAPGTFGSAAGLLLWAVLPGSAAVQGTAIVLTMIAGSWASHLAEDHFQTTDPAPVVIDEVMGMLATLFLVPVGWKGVLAAFLLFRLFDIIKPYPANRLEHLPGGIGVMADDLMAAVYANLALRVAIGLGNWGIS
jgi:phosphatidylglycerophosphatase A